MRKSDFNAKMIIGDKETNYWGVRYLSIYGRNDKISSIYVYANKSGKESGYYKIRFFEDDNFKGSCIEFKCVIMDHTEWDSFSDIYLCDKQDNLNKVIRKKRWLRKNITWDDCISSFYYYYTRD